MHAWEGEVKRVSRAARGHLVSPSTRRRRTGPRTRPPVLVPGTASARRRRARRRPGATRRSPRGSGTTTPLRASGCVRSSSVPSRLRPVRGRGRGGGLRMRSAWAMDRDVVTTNRHTGTMWILFPARSAGPAPALAAAGVDTARGLRPRPRGRARRPDRAAARRSLNPLDAWRSRTTRCLPCVSGPSGGRRVSARCQVG